MMVSNSRYSKFHLHMCIIIVKRICLGLLCQETSLFNSNPKIFLGISCPPIIKLERKIQSLEKLGSIGLKL